MLTDNNINQAIYPKDQTTSNNKTVIENRNKSKERKRKREKGGQL